MEYRREKDGRAMKIRITAGIMVQTSSRPVWWINPARTDVRLHCA